MEDVNNADNVNNLNSDNGVKRCLFLYEQANLLEKKRNLIREIFKTEILNKELNECTFHP